MTRESRKPLIVIVDDDVAVCRSIQQLMWSHWVHADAFTSARDFIAAIEAIPSFAPDCVVLDTELSELNGFDVLDRLHRSRPGVPVICVTNTRANCAPHVAPGCTAAPSFEKPLDLELLAETLLEILNIRSAVQLLKRLPKTRRGCTRRPRADEVH